MYKNATVFVTKGGPSLDQSTFNQFEERRRLFDANLYLVEEMAKQYVDFDVDLATLIQEGQKGFDISLNRYDPSKNFPFSNYAKWWIKRKISDVILSRHNLKK